MSYSRKSRIASMLFGLTGFTTGYNGSIEQRFDTYLSKGVVDFQSSFNAVISGLGGAL